MYRIAKSAGIEKLASDQKVNVKNIIAEGSKSVEKLTERSIDFYSSIPHEIPYVLLSIYLALFAVVLYTIANNFPVGTEDYD
jgi:hypothetical protein